MTHEPSTGEPLGGSPVSNRAAAPAILIVEDEAVSALCLAQQIRRMGYLVVGPVASGEKAVALTQQQPLALILMDIELAGTLDGYATAQLIQQHCSVPVIFLTQQSGNRVVEQAHHCGACDFLPKPYDEYILRDKISLALSKHDPDRCLRAHRHLSVPAGHPPA